MLKLDLSTDSDSDAEFQPLLRLRDDKSIHGSIEFIDKPDLLPQPPQHSPPPLDLLDTLPFSPTADTPPLLPCPCCQAQQSTFYCSDCVTSSASFYRAQLPGRSEEEEELSFSQRQDRLSQSLGRGRALRGRIAPRLEAGTQGVRGYQELARLEVKLRAQRQAIRVETERAREGRNRLRQLAARNSRREEQLAETSKQNFAEFLQECEERCSASRTKLSRRYEELTQARKQSLQEIHADCFPIHKVLAPTPVPGSQSVQLPSRTDLAGSPARSQELVWLGQGGEKYSILDCCLPPASVYVPKFCQQQREGAVSNSFDSSRPSTSELARIGILAALCYTAQLVRTVAFILDILLPDPISLSAFSLADTAIDCGELGRIAAQLENNIVYLAASQAVPSDLLLQGHTLENLLTLLNRKNPKLGQSAAFAPYPELSVREGQLLGTEAATPEEIVRGVSVGSETDSDWEDLEKSVALSGSCEGLDMAASVQQSQDSSRSRLLSFFWRSPDPDK